ncbi:hypothetical protein H4R18_002481 [Coemansia javaensis]|uniref:Uncharacterized protein n=1 Tax=Coemansia javaensis TaxID=2761396 RepID=A0A9W8HIB6_9FUNG|nr:hypothetical protein H4R18_002481 [Coemansia javaensis]
MKLLAVLSAIAAVAVAQQVGSSGGSTFSEGENAVSNSNVNNDQQFQNSVVSAGEKGGNVFHGLDGNAFADSISNMGLADGNFVNPAQTSVSGNSGPTANGGSNFLGNAINGGFGFGPHRKRDAVFNNFGPAPAWGYPGAAPAFAPVYAIPVYAHPARYAPVPVAGHINHNVQSAAIVQNQV